MFLCSLLSCQNVRRVCGVVAWLWLFVTTICAVAQTQPNIVWERAGLSGLAIHALTARGDTLFASTHRNGVFRSTDKGNTWTALNTGLLNLDVLSFAANGITLFAGTHGSSLFRSANDGASWNQTLAGDASALAWTIAVKGNIIILIDFTGKVSRSTDNGLTWENNITQLKGAYRLVLLRGNFYVGTSDGGYRSMDDGRTWQSIPTLNDAYTGGFIEYNNVLFAGAGGGIKRSTDGGTTWFRLANDLPFPVASFAISNNTLFAASGRNVYRLNPDGQWIAVSTELPAFGIPDIVVINNQLFAATFTDGLGGDGIYRAVAIPPPTLTASPSPLQLATTNINVGGAVQLYTLTGQNLTTSTITITAPPNVFLSLSQNGPFSATLSLPVANGTLPATTIYARLQSAIPLSVNGVIQHQSGSTSASVMVSGIVQSTQGNVSPSGITITPQALDFGTNVVGSTVTPLSYTISGTLATNDPITIVAPFGTVEISLSASGPYSSSLSLPIVNNQVNTIVYVRLITGMPISIFGNDITQSNGPNTPLPSVKVSGTVLNPPLPVLTVTPPALPFPDVRQNAPLPEVAYLLTGRNLTGDVFVTAPNGFQVFDLVTMNWVSGFVLPRTAERSTDATIRVRPVSTNVIGLIQGTVQNTTANATSQTVIVQGRILAPPPTLLPDTTLRFGTLFVGEVSPVLSYTLRGQNLPSLGAVNLVAADERVEMATQESGPFSSSLRIMTGSTGILTQSVFVRLRTADTVSIPASGVPIVNILDIGTTQATVRVFGTVLPRPQRLSVSPDSLTLGAVIRFDPAPQKTYTVTGANLVAPVLITAPNGVLLWNEAMRAWTSTLTLATSATGAVMQTIIVRLDSSVIRSLQASDVIQHQSGTTSASVRVTGAVVPLTLPLGTETALELRYLPPREPMLIGDTAKVQLWLRDTRNLTPRLVGQFVRKLRATLRIEANNLALLGFTPLSTTRTQFDPPMPPPAPRTSPLVRFQIERVDTGSTGNLLLAELLCMATFGATATNTLRLVDSTSWASLTDVVATTRVTWIPDSLRITILPLFAPRKNVQVSQTQAQSHLTAKVAPNPASDEVQIEYALENVSENTNNDAVSVVLILVDAAGREAYRKELGKRTVQTLHRETLVLPHLASASYLLLLETPREVLRARVDVVR